MPLSQGERVGPYEVLAPLGAGGMGEVYRARDSRLKREVALKVLIENVAADPDRLARFQREAELLATLNHSNIASIYGLEGSALVLELVEGPTLAARIARGRMSFEEALPVLYQIIDALEYAHEKGIVHRDLKPANIKITPSGTVKLLDFGLAKAFGNELSAGDPQSSPTMTSATVAGLILGTAQYMAPEQARGLGVDKRADIWAFGVIVYEMLTGKPPFAAPTITDTLALVITKELDFSDVPDRPKSLLRRCLERDPRKRLRDIGDARMLLDQTSASADNARPKNWLLIALGALALASMIAAAAFTFLHIRESAPIARPVRFEIPGESEANPYNSFSVSPDGRYVAFFVVNRDGIRVLRIRALDSLQTRTVPESEGTGVAMSWSPDSRFLVFKTGGKIKRTAVPSGPTETLSEMGAGVFSADWARDGAIYLVGTGLTRIPETGGPPTTLVPTFSGLIDFQLLPDGEHFLFSAGDAAVPGTSVEIFTGSVDSLPSITSASNSRPLVTSESFHFAFAPSQHAGLSYLFFVRDGALAAQAFDTARLELVGPAVTIAQNVVEFGASADVLAYRTGVSSRNQLRWFDRRGKPLETIGEPGGVGDLWISRDGKTIMIDRVESGTDRVWLGDRARGVFSRLTSAGGNETAGALAPDGTVVFTISGKGSAGDLYAIRPSNSTPELLVKSEFLKHPNDISPDGKYLIYDEHGKQFQDLFVLPLNVPGATPIPFVVTPADETFGQFSPDGKWVGYSSNESGRREVYVRAFLAQENPAAGARKWLVSTAGGDKPRWSRDGKELYYISLDGKMMATPVKIGANFEPGIPAPLFDVHPAGFFPYDVSADGLFLINTPLSQAGDKVITVVVNWSAALN